MDGSQILQKISIRFNVGIHWGYPKLRYINSIPGDTAVSSDWYKSIIYQPDKWHVVNIFVMVINFYSGRNAGSRTILYCNGECWMSDQ